MERLNNMTNILRKAKRYMDIDTRAKRLACEHVSIWEANGAYCQITRALWDVIVSNDSYPGTWVKAQIYDVVVWERDDNE